MLRALHLHGVQPYKLQIEVIIRKRLTLLGLKIGNVKLLAQALVRRTERSANVFSYPARPYLVFIFLKIKLHFESPS